MEGAGTGTGRKGLQKNHFYVHKKVLSKKPGGRYILNF